ncbi:MAG: hybrid sensor histidine kinase/response regulator [Magnetococcus sp. YQC-5]
MNGHQDGKPKLLLVDDMESNILMLNEALSDDYHTFFAMDGETALQLALEWLPDLILLDIQMPMLDGLEVCKRLKADPKTMRIPVIFITALSESTVEASALEVGAVDYITKPFNPTIVRLRVRNQLALKHYQNHLEELVLERTAKLQLAKEAAEASDRAKTRFLVILGHELRTPLNPIIGFADLLTAMLKEEDLLENAKCILSSALHLNSVVDNILDLVKLESGIMKISCKTLKLHDLIQKIGREVCEKFQEKELVFSSEIADDVPKLVQGDAKRICQVLTQLLENAFKFTSAGSVRLTVARHQDQLVFSVRDTGPGIPSDKLETIFGVFATASEDYYTQHKGGIGIGLAICQHLLRLMHGRVWVEKSGPDGSEFCFSIQCQE